jgi:hypothetical protein
VQLQGVEPRSLPVRQPSRVWRERIEQALIWPNGSYGGGVCDFGAARSCVVHALAVDTSGARFVVRGKSR